MNIHWAARYAKLRPVIRHVKSKTEMNEIPWDASYVNKMLIEAGLIPKANQMNALSFIHPHISKAIHLRLTLAIIEDILTSKQEIPYLNKGLSGF